MKIENLSMFPSAVALFIMLSSAATLNAPAMAEASLDGNDVSGGMSVNDNNGSGDVQLRDENPDSGSSMSASSTDECGATVEDSHC
jgi:hypothetical protein